jgi:lipid-A-disaccharide synthase
MGRWVLVSAGEVSGDRIAAPVVQAIASARPDLRFFGAGGPALRGAGVEVRHPIAGLAVTGLSEALWRLPAAARLLGDLAREIRRRRPGLALLVDYPGVHLRLAGLLRRWGVPVLYYVAPQRWAWLGWRTAALARCVDRLAVTLPFEESFFRARGVPATFVGNPVLDLFRPERREWARRALGLDGCAPPVVAVMPGSRPNEIRRHLPPLVRALALLPELRPVLATVPGSYEGAGLCRALAPGIVQADAPVALGAAEVGLCASGTATLEAAVAAVPTVVFYRVSPLTYPLARALVRVRMVALPNLLLGEKVLPELIQREMTPSRLASEVRRLLEPAAAERVRRALRRAVGTLGSPNVAPRVAQLALELLG